MGRSFHLLITSLCGINVDGYDKTYPSERIILMSGSKSKKHFMVQCFTVTSTKNVTKESIIQNVANWLTTTKQQAMSLVISKEELAYATISYNSGFGDDEVAN